jgi:hypothetical protein
MLVLARRWLKLCLVPQFSALKVEIMNFILIQDLGVVAGIAPVGAEVTCEVYES